ncbi:MAG: hypothetical protein PW734_06090 [Verrucomicrobium sp.]|nr:hypothetical protein [Verrucomicrobium sp.]
MQDAQHMLLTRWSEEYVPLYLKDVKAAEATIPDLAVLRTKGVSDREIVTVFSKGKTFNTLPFGERRDLLDTLSAQLEAAKAAGRSVPADGLFPLRDAQRSGRTTLNAGGEGQHTLGH